MKRIAILGSTGSIGTQTLDVVRMHPEALRVTGLAAHSNGVLLQEQAAEFRPKYLGMYDVDVAYQIGALAGMDGLIEIATSEEVDLVVVSVSGMIGLQPTIAALDAGKEVALASKEVLVAGGSIVMPKAAPNRLRPIDSEHSAVLQCLQGERLDQVDRIILTASGGPFKGWSGDRLETVTVEQALNHPTWRMGGKITIDSATLMNKGLELIEACWLFDISPDRVQIIVHPESIIHSMVKFDDGSVIGQLGHPDMKLPIQYALLGPERISSPAKPWSPIDTPNLSFEPLDEATFNLPEVAREAFNIGGLAPTRVNAVNEEAANAFLRGEIGFMDIVRCVERSLDKAETGTPFLESILSTDLEARKTWRELLARNRVSYN
ncbi:MAG: 1-deoxy-D-xylulose-5-phosphate reductoisomerase [Fimbriimonadales bacterium]